jgi:3-oxoadipate enol-lactonase
VAGSGRAGGRLAAHVRQVVSRWFTPDFAARYPSVPARFAATLDGVDPEGYAGCCEAIVAMDLRPDLAAITAPTLVISGSEDPATPPWHGAVIARGITRSRLAVIRGASHLANVSAPGEVTAALRAHLLAMAPSALDSPARRS